MGEATVSRDWYLFVDDNDGEGQRPATVDEIREFLAVASLQPQWFTFPFKDGVTMTSCLDTRGGGE